jgi:hypothetical protein
VIKAVSERVPERSRIAAAAKIFLDYGHKISRKIAAKKEGVFLCTGSAIEATGQQVSPQSLELQ